MLVSLGSRDQASRGGKPPVATGPQRTGVMRSSENLLRLHGMDLAEAKARIARKS
jgi:hypothetical protein